MKKVNMYGYKMNGLKAAAAETKGLRGYYDAAYVQISYDRATGDVLTNYHVSLGHNSWTEYHDSDVVTVCYASEHMTMQEIADAVAAVAA